MVSGAEEYYLGVVASGREDYYTSGGEAPGVWLGQGSASLGLWGQVGPGPLRVLLAGFSPTDGRRLTSRPVGAARVTGFDLTFSAPKSVSVLWGLSDSQVSGAVRRAHDGAVVEALGYLERYATMARRGANGLRRIEAGGLVAAGFRHRTSRAGDPQLHTHVLVANAVCGDDGRWSAPDARLLYFHARTGGFVYQAVLRARLVEALGVSFGPVVNGSAEVLGVGDDVIKTFATRRADIEAALERRGTHSARAAQLATLATRPAQLSRDPGAGLDGESLSDAWRRRAQELGLGPDDLRAALGPRRPVRMGDAQADALIGGLLGEQGLTAQTSTFERRDVVRGVASGLVDGAPAAVIDALSDRVLACDDVIVLEPTGRGGGRLHTTVELLAIEARLLATADAGRTTKTAVVDPHILQTTLAHRPSLSEEQRLLVGRLVSSGDALEVVVGKAGSGKTMALDAARVAWEEAGFAVTGAALAARAAAELTERSGIAADTVASLVARLERDELVFGPRQVVVLDEAAMIGTRSLATIVDSACQAGTKVVLVGDHRQLAEIEAGGSFAALDRRLGPVELAYNRRQHASWERAALDELRSGNVGLALDAYDARGRIHQSPNVAGARTALVADWLAARDIGTEVLMLAARRADVDALNRMARSALRGRGEIGPSVSSSASRTISLRDEVMCLRNDHRLGVRNGTRGTVVAGGEGVVVISTEDGPRRLDRAYLDAGWLDHGYATTIHKSQGQTVERAFILGTGGYREAAYVAMSRARDRTDLYVVDAAFEVGIEPTDQNGPLEALTKALSASRAKVMASDARGDRGGVATHGFRPLRTGPDAPVGQDLATESRCRSTEEIEAPSRSRGLGR
jgi:conjugative relaxase-like TrwC/TraI family protein